MQTSNRPIEFLRKQPAWRWLLAAAVPGLALWFAFSGSSAPDADLTVAVRRGDLQITVMEGGSIEALLSQEIRSEVKGGQGTKILKIVEEGYLVTEEDVKTGKVLVELDTSELRTRLTQQEIQFQSTLASLTEAVQAYEIQRNQNISNIKAAEQKAQFARMDLEKFLGDTATKEIIRLLRLDRLEAAAAGVGGDVEQAMRSAMESNVVATLPQAAESGSAPTAAAEAEERGPEPVKIDFASYAKAELLGDGSAMQQLRKYVDDLQSARQQQGLSQTKLAGTRQLFEKGFVTRTELDTDEISAQNNDLKVKTAETAYNLFIKYEFPKQAQELVSKYEEALRGLDRERKEAVSKLAQAQARLKGAQSRYTIESNQRKELLDQIEKCMIKAQKAGLVVYGGSSQGDYYGYEQIREGATVRERQPIITIPDMTQMAVRVKIHESYIQKVQKGLRAGIQVDAFPDRKLNGEVTKVGLLPDSQNRWFNPDLKVYQTTVNIEGSHEWLKPGMSAKVEILVKTLTNVLYVPVQAVSKVDNKFFCYLPRGSGLAREVEVGDFNDEFIEIRSGLEEGDQVLLRAPSTVVNGKAKNGAPKEKEGTPAPAQAPAASS